MCNKESLSRNLEFCENFPKTNEILFCLVFEVSSSLSVLHVFVPLLFYQCMSPALICGFLRERTHCVYQIYSRKPPVVVHSTLTSLGVDYVIIEDTWCHQRSREGCSMGEVWDLEDEKNRGNSLFCEVARRGVPKPFKKAFENDAYLVLRVPH